jgi:pyridoxal phosphate-dependent aminotransferase EpsN
MSGREGAYVADAIASNWVAPVGPHLAKFEQESAKRIGVKHALAVTTGTAAIHLAQRCLELQPGDEVICSTFTFCASINPAVYEGAKPVFIDSERETWNMDPNLLEEELADCARRGRLPRAVVVVDILGQSADIDAINGITSQYDIPVIEDAAQALGSTYKGRPAGSSSWASTFSWNGNKILTTSGGGLLCSNDEQLIQEALLLATQARDPVPYYQHSQIGFNYRMSNILAAIGLAQLEVLQERVEARRRIFQFYRDRLGQLPGLSLMPHADYGRSNCWLTMVQIDPVQFGATCDDVCRILEQQDIEARRVWKPLHLQPVFSGCRYRGGAVAEEVFAKGLFLPSGSAMDPQDLERVAAGVESAGRC